MNTSQPIACISETNTKRPHYRDTNSKPSDDIDIASIARRILVDLDDFFIDGGQVTIPTSDNTMELTLEEFQLILDASMQRYKPMLEKVSARTSEFSDNQCNLNSTMGVIAAATCFDTVRPTLPQYVQSPILNMQHQLKVRKERFQHLRTQSATIRPENRQQHRYALHQLRHTKTVNHQHWPSTESNSDSLRSSSSNDDGYESDSSGSNNSILSQSITSRTRATPNLRETPNDTEIHSHRQLMDRKSNQTEEKSTETTGRQRHFVHKKLSTAMQTCDEIDINEEDSNVDDIYEEETNLSVDPESCPSDCPRQYHEMRQLPPVALQSQLELSDSSLRSETSTSYRPSCLMTSLRNNSDRNQSEVGTVGGSILNVDQEPYMPNQVYLETNTDSQERNEAEVQAATTMKTTLPRSNEVALLTPTFNPGTSTSQQESNNVTSIEWELDLSNFNP